MTEIAAKQVIFKEADHLRQEALKTILVCLSIGLYAWGAFLFPAHDRVGQFEPVWVGPLLLAAGLTLAFVGRRHSVSLAGGAAIAGIAVAVLHGVWIAGMRVAPYMLAVVISATGLLFSLRTVAWTAALAVGAIIALGAIRWGYSPFSIEVLSPVLITATMGLFSSISIRNLYRALQWFQERAMAARDNEEALRERQSQLLRTLKALDQAYERLEHLNYDLERAREAAEAASLARQQLAANLSHELRTPLNVIGAFSETMYLSPDSYGGTPLPPQYRGDVRQIYRSSQHLLRMIEDVLDLARIRSGQMRIEPDLVDLRDVVNESIDMIRPFVREQEITLWAEIPPELPSLLCDRRRIQQVLLNLLNNARRFTRSGRIGISATQGAEWVRVTVADTGVGIPPVEHDRIFKEFYRIGTAEKERRDGTGLGLAVSKRFVEMHGGRIWLESDGVPGHGCRFHFTLPLKLVQVDTSSYAGTTHRHVRSPRGRGKSLLLLDRDPDVRHMLEQSLPDYHVVPVTDLDQVSDLVHGRYVRAIILNATYREQARRQLQYLRSERGLRELPIISCPLVGRHRLSRSLGVMDYLVKPVTSEELSTLLGRMEREVSRVLVVDDDAAMARVFSRLLRLQNREIRLQYACDGREGLQLMRSFFPDLVLLDLVMPHMDGYDVLAHMRDDPVLRDVPVALVTAQMPGLEDERRLGGGTFSVIDSRNLTNDQVLGYLHAVLEAAGGL